MPKVGDRVVVEGSKVGGARREGTLLKVVGSMIRVRWADGSETLFSPAAGTVQYLPGNGSAFGKPGAARPAERSKPVAKKPPQSGTTKKAATAKAGPTKKKR